MTTATHLVRAAVVMMFIVAAFAACSPSVRPTSPEPTPVGAVPLTPDDVERRLRALDPELTLVAPTGEDYADVFPDIAFQATTPAADGIGRTVHLVFIYPTIADRVAAQPMFQGNTIQGPGRTVTWDGISHSEWVGVDNVIVELILPGGVFGGRSPTPDEIAYPNLVRDALDP